MKKPLPHILLVLVAAWLPVSMVEAGKPVLADAFELKGARKAGAPLQNVEIEKGGGRWKVHGEIVFCERGGVSPKNSGDACMALAELPRYKLDKPISISAKVKPDKTGHVSVAFVSSGDAGQFWETVELWAFVNRGGNFGVLAHGTEYVLHTGNGSDYSYKEGDLTTLELEYDPASKTAAFRLNGKSIKKDMAIPEPPKAITHVAFRFNEPVEGGIPVVRDFAVSVEGAGLAAVQPSPAPEPATPVPPPEEVDLASLRYPLEQAHLLEPFWRSEKVYGESVAFVQEKEGEPAWGTLLFAPRQVLRVRSSDGITEFEEKRDYTVDKAHRRIVLTPQSRIPSIAQAKLYKRKGEADSISAKVGSPETSLLYREGWFRSIQAEVDYVRDETWSGYAPEYAESVLPKTIAKLGRGRLRICVTGDSIATGANASSKTPPYMPGFVPLTALALEKVFGAKVTVVNLARGGTWANGGAAKIPETVAAAPDLVIIAYGMNDVNGRRPAVYSQHVKAIIDGVRAKLPDAEFILVSSSLANPEWDWSPADQFVPFRDALQALSGSGIALADMTSLWTGMLKNKRYLDLAGNGINHPNDFGHRLYASVILSLLVAAANG